MTPRPFLLAPLAAVLGLFASATLPVQAAAPAPLSAAVTVPPNSASEKKLADGLDRAEQSWGALSNPRTPGPAFEEARTLYALAVSDVVDELNRLDNGPNLNALRGAQPWDWTKAGSSIRVGARRIILTGPESTPGAWKPGLIDRVETIRRPAENPTVPQAVRPGVGAPVMAIRKATVARMRDEPGMPGRGFFLPATAMLDFGAAPTARNGTVRLQILDPREVLSVSLGRRGKKYPLAADFATPVREEVGVKNFGLLSFVGFFRPEKALNYSGLYFFGPFDPNKIPVVFIHGLNSDPSIWENSTAAMMADPELGKRCQFWYFFYPTGSPVPASANRLRTALDRVRKAYDPTGTNPNMDRIILIGHSMGGLLAQLQIVDPGSQLYDSYFAVPVEKLRIPRDVKTEIQKSLFFSPRRDVDEVIFVCTPHRGSRIADWGVARLLSRLVAIPQRLVSVATQILTLNVDMLNPALRRSGLRGLSSIDSLSPANPYFSALEKMPLQRPFHSIIGDRGRGDTPNSSDGVVGYRSAHWDGAKSEIIVPYGHQCAMRPQVFDALYELVRKRTVEEPGASAAQNIARSKAHGPEPRVKRAPAPRSGQPVAGPKPLTN
jgi:pimeloyl-ACP methyl ester carboxylesterase